MGHPRNQVKLVQLACKHCSCQLYSLHVVLTLTVAKATKHQHGRFRHSGLSAGAAAIRPPCERPTVSICCSAPNCFTKYDLPPVGALQAAI